MFFTNITTQFILAYFETDVHGTKANYDSSYQSFQLGLQLPLMSLSSSLFVLEILGY